MLCNNETRNLPTYMIVGNIEKYSPCIPSLTTPKNLQNTCGSSTWTCNKMHRLHDLSIAAMVTKKSKNPLVAWSSTTIRPLPSSDQPGPYGDNGYMALTQPGRRVDVGGSSISSEF